jgi:hypothetical protein
MFLWNMLFTRAMNRIWTVRVACWAELFYMPQDMCNRTRYFCPKIGCRMLLWNLLVRNAVLQLWTMRAICWAELFSVSQGTWHRRVLFRPEDWNSSETCFQHLQWFRSEQWEQLLEQSYSLCRTARVNENSFFVLKMEAVCIFESCS